MTFGIVSSAVCGTNSFVLLFTAAHTLAVPDLGKPGHCPGKILVNCGYCLWKLVAAPPPMAPAQVTWQL